VVIKSDVQVQTQAGFHSASTPKYRAAYEHDTPPNHIKMRVKMYTCLIMMKHTEYLHVSVPGENSGKL